MSNSPETVLRSKIMHSVFYERTHNMRVGYSKDFRDYVYRMPTRKKSSRPIFGFGGLKETLCGSIVFLACACGLRFFQ